VRPLPLTQVENRAERGVAPNQLGVLGEGELSLDVLPIQAAAVRARCERRAVERCRVTFVERSESGLTVRVWSVGAGWCLAS